jgi:hypothetical protein
MYQSMPIIVYTSVLSGLYLRICWLLGCNSLHSWYKCTDASEEPAARLEYLPVSTYHICTSDLSLYLGSYFDIFLYFLTRSTFTVNYVNEIMPVCSPMFLLFIKPVNNRAVGPHAMDVKTRITAHLGAMSARNWIALFRSLQ